MFRLERHEVELCKQLGTTYASDIFDGFIEVVTRGNEGMSTEELKKLVFDDYTSFSEAAEIILSRAKLIERSYPGSSSHELLYAYKLFEGAYERQMNILIDRRARLYLEVPYAEKDLARESGALWDPLQKKWYAPTIVAAQSLERWRPTPKPVNRKRPQAAPSLETIYPKGGPQRLSPLYIDLVPSTAWFSNLRSEITQEEWSVVRRATYRKARYLCEVCGGKGAEHPVECHERWSFDAGTRVQRLIGTVALCPACHLATHYGFARISGKEKVAKNQILTVNGWTEDQLLDHIRLAEAEWLERSRINWSLDATWLIDFVNLSDKTRLKINQHAQGLIKRTITQSQKSTVDSARRRYS